MLPYNGLLGLPLFNLSNIGGEKEHESILVCRLCLSSHRSPGQYFKVYSLQRLQNQVIYFVPPFYSSVKSDNEVVLSFH
jgi:hypothetical protein